jgi:ParB/RepB/Spo0J family partition protein
MSGEIAFLELKRIRPNKFNPRLDFDEEGLARLADSIKERGLLQPIVVRPVGDYFEVVFGERRYRAAKKANVNLIPALINEYSDEEALELTLVENIQRTDLSAVEKGNSCKQLMKKYPSKFPDNASVAKALNVSERTISSWLELVEAPKELQSLVAPAAKIGVPRPQGKIDWDTAVTITRRISEPARQVSLAKEIAKRPIYRREARKVISKAASEPEKPIEQVFKEVIETPYEMPFRLSHMQPILKGIKTQTSRKGIPDPKIAVGSTIHAAVWEPHFADLIVTSIERKRLKDFTEDDAYREGGYTLEEFREVWKTIHGQLDENESVYVISFKKKS